MDLAVIVPPGAEDLVPDEYPVMAFADIAFHNPVYARFYASRPNVIMDNQIYEGDEGLEARDLAFILSFVQPNVAIVPDVRGDWLGTKQRADAYLSVLCDALPPNVHLCGVVQGRTLEDVRASATWWGQDSRVSWIAAPIKPVGLWPRYTRYDLYVRFVYQRAVNTSKPVHWLGMESYAPDAYDRTQAENAYPHTLDTAEPTTATIYGVDLEDWYRTFGEPGYVLPSQNEPLLKRPPDFMTWPGYVDILHQRKELLWRNFAWTQKLLSGQLATEQVFGVKESPKTE